MRRTARIDVSLSSGVVGSVYVATVQIVHAAVSGLTGREAFIELLQIERGGFRIRFDREAPATSIDIPTGFFVLDCLRTVDELRAQRAEGPATTVGPAPEKTRRKRSRSPRSDAFHLAPPR